MIPLNHGGPHCGDTSYNRDLLPGLVIPLNHGGPHCGTYRSPISESAVSW